MELGSIIQFLENKSIFMTGVTGFLAKTFLEKLIRVQPNVKKLYLLLRASDATTAVHRFLNEVIKKDLFKVVKEELGENLEDFISKKIIIIPGDVGLEDLGIQNSSLREELEDELDVVLNFAATTNFDERYDVALRTNTMGVKHVLSFAKSCPKLKLLVHVSTAYVCGERSGLILENPYHLNDISELDIDKEKELVDKTIDKLRAQGATETTIKTTMKDIGIERAKMYGWPNTYVFTKAMGEMQLGLLKGNLPTVIIRPTMVTSTYKEPFPGWIEGARTIDALTVGYGRGKVKFFVGDLATIFDVIPVDMVVNAIIVVMVAHASQSYGDLIYHVGSSARNPMTYSNLKDYMYSYFTKKPWIGENGKPVKVEKPVILKNMVMFHRYVALRYLPFLKGLKLANKVSCHYFQGRYNTLRRRIKFLMRLVELYQPYLFFQGVFDDSNMKKLLQAGETNCIETRTFFLDVESIDWNDYFMQVHAPGVVKYVFRR